MTIKDSKNTDFYINSDGNTVFTKEFHLRRGYCCESNCLHCPYGFGDRAENDENSEVPHELRQTKNSDQPSDEDLAQQYLDKFNEEND